MAELLLELLSEEIPAGMQEKAARDLADGIVAELALGGYRNLNAYPFVTPRRLIVKLEPLPFVQPDRREERKGPRVGAPDKALQGFLKSVGLTKSQLETRSDKKGDYYVAILEQKGRSTEQVIAELIPVIVRSFSWPKSMRWGAGSLRWVRPLQSILCLFDGHIVPFEIDGIKSGTVTRGHRFMAPEEFEVAGFEDYAAKLSHAKVEIDAEKRFFQIATSVRKLAEDEGYELVTDEALVRETAGLVEWPVVLLGQIDAGFVKPVDQGGLPREVLTTAMRKHQKYFSLRDPKTGRLAPRFAVVANLQAADGGDEIIAGNERVLRARLSDAKFFWDQDRKSKLESRVDDLKRVIFHDKLGTVRDKVHRVESLAGDIAQSVGADIGHARRAALLAKADLTSDMVGEFPDLQGLMGRYYALAEGESNALAAAIEEHYAPQGPGDDCPSAPISMAVALADKIDTLVGFWLINEKPTGSKDPYALRRAALGVIRIVLENKLRLSLMALFVNAESNLRGDDFIPSGYRRWSGSLGKVNIILIELLVFFADRLKVYLKGKGARHDLIDAVFALGGQDDLIMIIERVDALAAFLGTEDGANLRAAYKRATNILVIEEKNDKTSYRAVADVALLTAPEERALHDAITAQVPEAKRRAENEDYTGAMAAIARLRGPVDAFFDAVKVNVDDEKLRRNRLRLLSQIGEALETVADFSKIEG